MHFRQLYHIDSGTYTYLLASSQSRRALLIDPVREQLGQYRQLLAELELNLAYAIDTHTHADHVTALGALREATGCTTVMGEFTQAHCVSQTVSEDEVIAVDDIELRALFTPGHTNESFSFYLQTGGPGAVFTGDVLLIRGSGRTDFQGGDPHKSWQSITGKLFALPDDTLVYPGHDYKGWTVSTIGEEKRHNPRLAGKSEAEYVAIMEGLHLPDPKLMDVAISANRECGQPGFRDGA